MSVKKGRYKSGQLQFFVCDDEISFWLDVDAYPNLTEMKDKILKNEIKLKITGSTSKYVRDMYH